MNNQKKGCIFAAMKDLSRHIEYLLLEHDCVIIPHFGAFVANHMNSQWSADEELFLPPYRTVHFNDHIRHDDNLLLNSIIKSYHISSSLAEQEIVEFVSHVKQQLLENGSFDFGSIGLFTQEGENSAINFSPCQAGIATPHLYGLDSFQFRQLPQQLLTAKVISSSKLENNLGKIHTDEKHIVIRINKHVANYVAAITASVILFFSFATPVSNTTLITTQTADTQLFIPQHLQTPKLNLPAAAQPQLLQIYDEDIVESTNEPVVKSEEIKPEQQVNALPETEARESQSSYAIVLASSVSKSNAENYVKNLKSRGYDASIHVNGKMVRVIIPGFATSHDAHEKMENMRMSSDEFKGIWMLKID